MAIAQNKGVVDQIDRDFAERATQRFGERNVDVNLHMKKVFSRDGLVSGYAKKEGKDFAIEAAQIARNHDVKFVCFAVHLAGLAADTTTSTAVYESLFARLWSELWKQSPPRPFVAIDRDEERYARSALAKIRSDFKERRGEPEAEFPEHLVSYCKSESDRMLQFADLGAWAIRNQLTKRFLTTHGCTLSPSGRSKRKFAEKILGELSPDVVSRCEVHFPADDLYLGLDEKWDSASLSLSAERQWQADARAGDH